MDEASIERKTANPILKLMTDALDGKADKTDAVAVGRSRIINLEDEVARLRKALTVAASRLADSGQSWFWANERQDAIDAINRALAEPTTAPTKEPT